MRDQAHEHVKMPSTDNDFRQHRKVVHSEPLQVVRGPPAVCYQVPSTSRAALSWFVFSETVLGEETVCDESWVFESKLTHDESRAVAPKREGGD